MMDVINVFNSHKNTAYLGKEVGKIKNEVIVGKCPLCGEDLLDKGKIITCSSNKVKKINNK